MRAAQLPHLCAFFAFSLLILERFPIDVNADQICLPHPDSPPIFFLSSGAYQQHHMGFAFISQPAMASWSVFLITPEFWLQASHWIPGPHWSLIQEAPHRTDKMSTGGRSWEIRVVVGHILAYELIDGQGRIMRRTQAFWFLFPGYGNKMFPLWTSLVVQELRF